jgi:hypothetical protein
MGRLWLLLCKIKFTNISNISKHVIYKAMTEFFICPAGKYCGNGTYVPEDCPPGTFSDR